MIIGDIMRQTVENWTFTTPISQNEADGRLLAAAQMAQMIESGQLTGVAPVTFGIVSVDGYVPEDGLVVGETAAKNVKSLQAFNKILRNFLPNGW